MNNFVIKFCHYSTHVVDKQLCTHDKVYLNRDWDVIIFLNYPRWSILLC